MAKKEVLELEVKSNIKGIAKDQKEWNKELEKTKDKIEDVNEEGKEVVAEMQILGLSINGLKAGWQAAASGAKFMFRNIKMGIASTGVGLFVLALGAISTWFAKTKKGAEVLAKMIPDGACEVLEVAFKGIGAAVSVITDRIAEFGGGLFDILSGNFSKGLTAMFNSFKGIGTEIKNDSLLTMALTVANQKLVDSQRTLSVETAQRRADIEELKLIAEDTTRTEEERLKAAQDAFQIENDLLERNIKNAEEAVRLERLRHDTIKPMKDDLDKLAQLEIDLANIRGESTTKQIELNNKINSIKQETINKNLEIRSQNQAIVDETADMLTQIELLRIEDDHNRALRQLEIEKDREIADAKEIKDVEQKNKRIAAINDLFQEKYLDLVDKKFKITVDGNKKEEKSTEDTTEARLGAFSKLSSSLSALAGDNKELAAASAIIDTYAGASKAFAQGGVAGFVTGAAIIAAGLANVQKIYATPIPGGGSDGGGGGPDAVIPEPPAPQMMSGAFELGGGVAPEPLRAFVITDEMTSSQAQLANIRRRATI